MNFKWVIYVFGSCLIYTMRIITTWPVYLTGFTICKPNQNILYTTLSTTRIWFSQFCRPHRTYTSLISLLSLLPFNPAFISLLPSFVSVMHHYNNSFTFFSISHTCLAKLPPPAKSTALPTLRVLIQLEQLRKSHNHVNCSDLTFKRALVWPDNTVFI